MLKTLRIQLNPNKNQINLIERTLGCSRFVYNYSLKLKKELFELDKGNLSYNDLSKNLTILKKNENYKWLNEVSSVALQQSLRNLDTAYQNFYKSLKTGKHIGFPKFKKKNNNCSFKNIKDIGIDFHNHKIKIPKVGKINFHLDNRIFDISKVKINSITISKISCGKYFANVLVEDFKELPVKSNIGKSIGIDLGIKDFLTTSNGDKISNPKYYEKYLFKLKSLQRKLSKKVRGSNHYKKLKLKLAKLHYKISNLRKDFLHKLSNLLLSENQTITIESLDVKNMLQNKYLSKSISSASWAEFIRILTYKAEWLGKNIIKIDKYFASSKLCNICNTKNDNLTLADREWTCKGCETTHDRDVNAAINILNKGLSF